jgi:arsenite methyltransferase
VVSIQARFRICIIFLALNVAARAGLGQQSPCPWDPQNRDKWQRPEEVMDDLRIKPGSVVADVGCGRGYFAIHLADRVGPQGKVYAVDINEDEIDGLQHKVLSEWLVQVKAQVGADDNPYLPRGRVDAILVVHAYHEMHEHDAMVEAFYRALKPRGLLGIIEFDAPDDQPRDESYEKHRIPPRVVRQEITSHRFRFVAAEPGFKAGTEKRNQSFLVFEKAER